MRNLPIGVKNEHIMYKIRKFALLLKAPVGGSAQARELFARALADESLFVVHSAHHVADAFAAVHKAYLAWGNWVLQSVPKVTQGPDFCEI